MKNSLMDDQQLDDNLLKSIETLLEDDQVNFNSTQLPAASMPLLTSPQRPLQPVSQADERKSPISTRYKPLTPNTFVVGNKVYCKWSTVESDELNVPNHLYYNSNQQMPTIEPILVKTTSVPNVLPSQPNYFNHHQMLLAEKATQFWNQYFLSNYELLSAQASILGLSLEEYLQNLIMATNTHSQATYASEAFALHAVDNIRKRKNTKNQFRVLTEQSTVNSSHQEYVALLAKEAARRGLSVADFANQLLRTI